MIRRAAGMWIALIVSCPLHTHAETPIPASAELPLLVVNAGRAVSPEEIQEVVDGLETPVTRGRSMMDRIGILPPPDVVAVANAARQFAAAEDLFFNGLHREATVKFSRIVEWAAAHPEQLFLEDGRSIVFKSHIHLAVIAAGDERLVDEHLLAAAAFQNMEPRRADFPPWVCEAFASARAELAASLERTASVAVSEECRLFAAGRIVGAVDGTTMLFPGESVFQATCNGKRAVPRRVNLSRGRNEIAPLGLLVTAFEEQTGSNLTGDLTLRTAPGVEDADLAGDLLTVLRGTDAGRLVAVIGKPGRLAVWLIDRRSEHPLRSAQTQSAAPAAARRAAASVAVGPEPDTKVPLPTPRPWYRDKAAWALLGTGVAALGVGVALHNVYGSGTRQESIALATMIGGGGLMGTGFVLFFVPTEETPGGKHRAKAVPVFGMGRTF